MSWEGVIKVCQNFVKKTIKIMRERVTQIFDACLGTAVNSGTSENQKKFKQNRTTALDFLFVFEI